MTADQHAASPAPAPGAEGPEGKKAECKWCERGTALLGLAAGLAVVFVAADLFLGGALTDRAAKLLGRGGGEAEGDG